MMVTAFKAMAVVTVVLGGWLLVQAGWRRVFAPDMSDEHVPSGTVGNCDGCRTGNACQDLSDANQPLPDSKRT